MQEPKGMAQKRQGQATGGARDDCLYYEVVGVYTAQTTPRARRPKRQIAEPVARGACDHGGVPDGNRTLCRYDDAMMHGGRLQPGNSSSRIERKERGTTPRDGDRCARGPARRVRRSGVWVGSLSASSARCIHRQLVV